MIAADNREPDGEMVAKLLALFDAAFLIADVNLALFEEEAPGAEYAARLWASAKGLRVEVRTNDVDHHRNPFEVVHIRRGFKTLISIHRREPTQTEVALDKLRTAGLL